MEVNFRWHDLKGWKAADMSVWSVEDGAITGTVTPEHKPQENVFIVWQDGKVDDFELNLNFVCLERKPIRGCNFEARCGNVDWFMGTRLILPNKGNLWEESGMSMAPKLSGGERREIRNR